MKEVTLEKLNSSTFESIVKALALEHFGLAGQVFPSGPDAGRDFSYDGSIAPYQAQGWNGYLVVQAKFKSKLSGVNEVKWLLDQLKSELMKFLREDSQYRKPEYYIIATNINLSGADGKSKDKLKKSGLTKVTEHMEEWKKSIGLKDFDIWPSEKIETLLVGSEDIRTTYLPSIITGDILKKISNSLDQKEKNEEYALKISLVHLLKRDKGVRLKDAGSLSDDEIRTSQVFVDLPVRSYRYQGQNNKFVAQIVEQSKGIFNVPISEIEQTKTRNRPNKVVLLGGPGQGKSTASLFLAQLFRASLIKEAKDLPTDSAASQLVSEIFVRAESESISSSLPSRYPTWISLPQFADSISAAKANKTKKPSLLSFAADEISETSQSEFTVNSLRAWLKSFPSIFILDGLDEVPPSGERSSILSAIQDLVIETQILNSDSFFVLTTRPQGYNSDLGNEEWSHRELADLPLETAMSYARLLAKSYYKDDNYRQSKIIAQLTRSAHHSTTQRLMRSPLQVTILHMIVDTGGGVPSSRWSLFHEYFEILKKREKSKGGEIQRTLDKNLNQVGPIHQRAGLILHVDSEAAGSATASLELEKLSNLIENYLKSEGFDPLETADRLSELTELSLHRLVLLSSREEGKISFDVRSLQEFMAAAALTASSPEVIEERLLSIAGKAHWQHVFTIAASRCFSQDNLFYLRSAITQLPKRLEDSVHHKVAGNGALLSYALFADDIAADHPTYRRILASHALQLLLHGFSHNAELQILIEDHTKSTIYDDLQNIYLCNSDDMVRAAAWDLIISESQRGSQTATDIINEQWPRDVADAYKIISQGVYPIHIENYRPSILQAILTTSFIKSLENGDRLANSILDHLSEIKEKSAQDSTPVDDSSILLTLQALTLIMEQATTPALGLPDRLNPVSVKYSKIKSLADIVIPATTYDIDPEWAFIFACVRFSRQPSPASLKEALSSFSKTNISPQSVNLLIDLAPWIISTIIKSDEYAELDYSKDLTESVGSADEWLIWEADIEKNGFKLHDIQSTTNNHLDSSNIKTTQTISPLAFVIDTGTSDSGDTILHYIETYNNSTDPKIKYTLARFIQFEAMALKSLLKLMPDTVLKMLNILSESLNHTNTSFPFIYHEALSFIEDFNLPEEHIKLLAELSPRLRVEFAESHFNEIEISPNFHLLCSHINIDQDKKGLLVLICILRVLHKNTNDTLRPELLRELANDGIESISHAANTLLLLDKQIEVPAYIMQVKKIITGENIHHYFNLSFQILDNKIMTSETKIALATDLTKTYQDMKFPNAWRLKSKLRSLLDSELSGLGNTQTWRRLMLPEDALLSNHPL